jgi:uncharacterized protein YegP (UPF0339 family)
MYAQVWQSPNDGLWYWHVRGANHEVVSQGEGHPTKDGAIRSLRLTFKGPIR